jgi:hypothetical protein
MTIDREKLIEAAERAYWRERAKDMSDSELMEAICSGLGVPAGTQFTEGQLRIIADHRASTSLSHQERS